MRAAINTYIYIYVYKCIVMYIYIDTYIPRLKGEKAQGTDYRESYLGRDAHRDMLAEVTSQNMNPK